MKIVLEIIDRLRDQLDMLWYEAKMYDKRTNKRVDVQKERINVLEDKVRKLEMEIELLNLKCK